METKEIHLSPEFEKAILDLGFSEFTEIQEKCIPLIQQGKDVIGLSYTGSGKTAAFGFPALEKVNPGKGLQLLVMVTTRELCVQVAKEFRKFTKYRKTFIVEVYGGVSIGPQIDNLQRADVVVGTPGRLLDHLGRGTLETHKIHILVIDEADKMFEMGFSDDVKKIISQVPKNSQKLLFSATMPQDIMDVVRQYMKNPEKIKMQTYVDKDKLIQHYYDVDRRDKFSLLAHIIKQNPGGLILVFCGTRHMVDAVSKNLYRQNSRTQVMDAFRDGKLDVLVASDVAARGLDIKNVNLVINYDIPKTSQEYVHRIGRTARAGSEGKVISFLCSEDHDNFRRVLQDRSLLIQNEPAPQFPRVEFVRAQRQDGFGSRGGPRGGGQGRGYGGHGARDSRGPRRDSGSRRRY